MLTLLLPQSLSRSSLQLLVGLAFQIPSPYATRTSVPHSRRHNELDSSLCEPAAGNGFINGERMLEQSTSFGGDDLLDGSEGQNDTLHAFLREQQMLQDIACVFVDESATSHEYEKEQKVLVACCFCS